MDEYHSPLCFRFYGSFAIVIFILVAFLISTNEQRFIQNNNLYIQEHFENFKVCQVKIFVNIELLTKTKRSLNLSAFVLLLNLNKGQLLDRNVYQWQNFYSCSRCIAPKPTMPGGPPSQWTQVVKTFVSPNYKNQIIKT